MTSLHSHIICISCLCYQCGVAGSVVVTEASPHPFQFFCFCLACFYGPFLWRPYQRCGETTRSR
ncbi:Protein of unknown function [Pyronema omphalodes CBS 100304]|uniref:Uncharacterized protein n=1 Tax=Pyronema omphalodes (strain CBS 100304) TaxID=1076935 RepID=U4L038_PYROM|nr:Protein of unknown function [Pyronema omphalodes CBS 100304]